MYRWSELLLDWLLNVLEDVASGAPVLNLLWKTIIYPERDSRSDEEGVSIECPTFSKENGLSGLQALTIKAQESFNGLWPLLGALLQRLSIHNIRDPNLSVQNFLETLATCHDLISLTLHNTSFKEKIVINPDNRIVLRNLAHFDYHAGMPEDTLVLAALDIPGAKVIRIHSRSPKARARSGGMRRRCYTSIRTTRLGIEGGHML